METTIDPQRAAVLHEALVIALEEVKRQLSFKQSDLFRTSALRMQLASFEVERDRLAPPKGVKS